MDNRGRLHRSRALPSQFAADLPAWPGALLSVYRFLYSLDMKTTLDIDDELLVKAKAASAREHKSLTALIEEGLRLRLRRSTSKQPRSGTRIAIYRGTGGLATGIDPLCNRAMLDAADDGA